MRRALFLSIAAAVVASPTLADDGPAVRDWPSARFRNAMPTPTPCSCRGPSGSVEVGEDVCLTTPSGGRRARCVMVLNNTSWAVSGEACGSVASLRR